MNKLQSKLKELNQMLIDDGYNGSNIVIQTLEEIREETINYTRCCTELPDLKDVNDEMYKVSNNLKTDHKQTEVNYYESGFLTCYHWLAKRMKK